eukprot:8307106-Alexandrium_andersonii.AAC.1
MRPRVSASAHLFRPCGMVGSTPLVLAPTAISTFRKLQRTPVRWGLGRCQAPPPFSKAHAERPGARRVRSAIGIPGGPRGGPG